MKSNLKQMIVALSFAGACIPQLALAQDHAACPDHEGGFGPFDYASARAEDIGVVERHHFTPQVESLARGVTGTVGGEIDYTIRAFPNHYRALNAMSKLSIREKTPRPRGLHCCVDGYFERAIRFRPEDAMVRTVYGLHLHRWKKMDKAKQQFEEAARLAPDDVNIAYNLGLVYADLKEWEKASRYAQVAYGGGFALPGLKNKLQKAGKWKEPTPRQVKADETNLKKPSGDSVNGIPTEQADVKEKTDKKEQADK
ncbi:MAG: hypothetical protein H0U63_01440 [Burkholderiales bacterium]|nr:hypothetical protein [Burkholderiales bacterium]